MPEPERRERVNRRGYDEDIQDKTNLALAQFVEQGLLWLVNTAILHPRGYALGVVRHKETKEPTELVLLGDGSEPWHFQPGEFNEVFHRYEEAERDRNVTWFPEGSDHGQEM